MKKELVLGCFLMAIFVIDINFIPAFEAEVEYRSGIQCTPNAIYCEEGNLFKCSSDGKNKELYQNCQFGCESSTPARCLEDIEETIDYTKTIIIGIAIIIGFIILALILKNKKRK